MNLPRGRLIESPPALSNEPDARRHSAPCSDRQDVHVPGPPRSSRPQCNSVGVCWSRLAERNSPVSSSDFRSLLPTHHSIPEGNGGSIGVPRTKCFWATRTRSGLPGSASSGVGILTVQSLIRIVISPIEKPACVACYFSFFHPAALCHPDPCEGSSSATAHRPGSPEIPRADFIPSSVDAHTAPGMTQLHMLTSTPA